MRLPFAVTVKSYIAVFLVVLALASFNRYELLLQLALAVFLAASADIAINFIKVRKIIFPSSAIISGLFVGSILPLSPIFVLAFASFLAIFSKHIIKFHKRHVFNPAGLGIVASGLAFSLVPVWWSSPTPLVIPLGLFILYKLRKWFLAFSFLITYSVLLLLRSVSVISAVPLYDPTLLFFAFFMLTEPLTSTYAKSAMVAQGIMVGVLVILVSTFVSGTDIFLLPLLISDLFVGTLNKRLRNMGVFKSKSEQPVAQGVQN